jgi:hypothetical protein
MIQYDVYSPDGFSILREDFFASIEEAEKGFEYWKKGFAQQGYYSSNKGPITLRELKSKCLLIKFDTNGKAGNRIDWPEDHRN